jgi:hypothetical protein
MATRWIKAGVVAHNAPFRPAVESSSFFSSTKAFVDVYAPKPDCRLDYLGAIALDRPAVERGFPAGETS